MPSVFTRIISGEIPGRFVWSDEQVVAFLTVEPQSHGHVLVVPRDEVDQWTDLPDALRDRLFEVSQRIGRALLPAFDGDRIGLVIAGYGVPHAHVHVYPVATIHDFDQTRAMKGVPPAVLDADAQRVREALASAGEGDHVPGEGPLEV